jgi:leucyl aminopeptidase
MRKLTLSILLSFFAAGLFAQSSEWIYATMENESALTLQSENPDGIQILSHNENISAVYLKKEVASSLKGNNSHGPGYIFRGTSEKAIAALDNKVAAKFNILDFTITEDAYVNQVLGLVNETNLGNTILQLQNYGTRFHSTSSGRQAALDIKDNWQSMVTAANRPDISVSLFNHQFSQQKSVILSIPGSEFPDEIVVIGGHLDSGDWSLINNAPGADDNASGIATLTETLRILLDQNFRPKRTVQIMGYAAEEIGLVGSDEIAEQYDNQNKNVIAMAQFDMTNYKGSSYDVALISDPQYTSSELNLFWVELLQHYNSSGAHQITYGNSQCGYGCSDHVSWTERGYLASFPFEAAFNQANPNVHSTNDTFAAMNNDASHSVKFVKLALEFVIEIAKVGNLSTQDLTKSNLSVVVKNKELIYHVDNVQGKLSSLQIFDSSARSLINQSQLNPSGSISLQGIPSGYYIVVLKDAKGKAYSKKFLLK